MRRTLKYFWTGTRWCLSCVWSFVVWSIWLALVLLLGVQGYIATHDKLEVPGFLLRSLEERLAASGVRTSFGATSFDPAGGHLLVEKVSVFLPAYPEPVATARSIYVRLNPWLLAAGQFDPSELRVSGANLAVPAMLSPSGRAEEILREADFTIVPHDKQLELRQFTGRVAGVTLVAHGAIHLAPRDPRKEATPLPTADFLARNYPALSRQLIAVSQKLALLESPSLEVELTPSETRAAIAQVTVMAEGLKLDLPQPVQLTGLRGTTRIPLLGDAPVTTRVDVTAETLALPYGASAQRLNAHVNGILRPGKLQYTPSDVELTIDALSARGFSARTVSARLVPGPLPQLSADLTALIMDAPLAVHAETDLTAQAATIDFKGALSTQLLTPLSEIIGVNVRKFFDYSAIERASGTVRLGPGWKFERVATRLHLSRIDAYSVIMEDGYADLVIENGRIYASEAYARIGENYARGTYEMDIATRDYRFLLDGRLRPLAIGGWWRSGWWDNFFTQFQFPDSPPPASVDVGGRWTDGRQSRVFVFTDASHPIIRGAALDRVRTRIFLRPGFVDGLEMHGTHPTGAVNGVFTFINDPNSPDWISLDLSLTSTLDPSVAVTIIGPSAVPIFAPFKWGAPPELKIAGRFDGSAGPTGAHTTLTVEGRTTGEFRFQDFPLENVIFSAGIRDDDIDLTKLEGRFGDGGFSGHAKVLGSASARKVIFDFALKDASLARAAVTLQDYTARRKGEAPTPPGKFLQEKAFVRIDVSAAAEGRYDDPLSFHGDGKALIQGPGLGEVHLLGLLSQLFTFTSLRFNVATSRFKIDGAKLSFPDLSLRGANSVIDAHGDFDLDHRTLEFKARVLPFQESTGIIKSLAGVVLSPFTTIFEVKLTGTLDKPEWTLAVNPANLLRSITPGDSKAPTPAAPTPSPSTPNATTLNAVTPDPSSTPVITVPSLTPPPIPPAAAPKP